jgi:ribonucleoside-diphosphate reductase alpha chain
MFDCASGLEPNFALVFLKSEVMGGQTLYYVNHYFEEDLKRRGLYSEDLMREVSKTGSIQNLDLPQDMKDTYVTAMDIPAEDHIRMQAAFQKHVDNSITKTINFASNATKEDVAKGYLLAWELGCKGCTVYRDKSRKIQVLSTVGEDEVKTPDEIKAEIKQAEGKQEGFVASKAQMKSWENCPACTGENLHFAEGCVTCKDCGQSACFI